MPTPTELILFIPGLSGAEAEVYLDKFIKGLSEHATSSAFKVEQIESSDEGQNRTRILLETSANTFRTMDIEVIPWAHLITKLSGETPVRKVMRGFSLLGFWVLNPKVWSVVTGNKYMLLGTAFAVLFTILWYLGVLSVFISTLTSTSQIATEYKESLYDFLEPLIHGMTIPDWLNGAYLLAFSTLMVTVFPVTSIVDIAYATQNYVLNRNSFFNKVRSRVAAVLNLAARETKYKSITIVAYSFGSVVAVEAMQAYKGNMPVRLITLGSPLMLLSAVSPRVKAAVNELAHKKQLLEWVDFYSEQDWLCTRSPLEEGNKFSSSKLTASVAFDEKIKGTSHELYFSESDVMEKVLVG